MVIGNVIGISWHLMKKFGWVGNEIRYSHGRWVQSWDLHEKHCGFSGILLESRMFSTFPCIVD